LDGLKGLITINGTDLLAFALSMSDVLNLARRRTINGQSYVLLEEQSAALAVTQLFNIIRNGGGNEILPEASDTRPS
jgi:hypothetical protein